MKNAKTNGVYTSKDRRAFNILAYAFIILIAVLCVLPFWLVIVGSFTSEAEIYSRGYSLIPHEFSLEAYQMAFKYPDRVLRAYGITVSITALGTFLSLLITSMCGYALQRDDFKSRGFFTMFVFFTMLFSGGLVPWYLLITNYLKLKDTYLILILTQLVNVFYVILMKNFMKTVPKALIEAAKIDGANAWQCFWRIKFPLIAPTTVYVLLTSVIFAAERAFTAINLLTQGGPSYSTTNLSYVIYEFAFKYYNIGTASAIAVFTSIIFLVITIIMMRSMGGFGYHDQK